MSYYTATRGETGTSGDNSIWLVRYERREDAYPRFGGDTLGDPIETMEQAEDVADGFGITGDERAQLLEAVAAALEVSNV